MAVKSQQMKHGLLWLTQRVDRYVAAWIFWAFQSAHDDGPIVITPLGPLHTHSPRSKISGASFRAEICACLRPSDVEQEALRDRHRRHMSRLISQTACWRDGDRLTIWLAAPLPAVTWEILAVSRRYWPTYWWTDNPWLCDGTGHRLTRTKYDRIRPC